MLGDKTPMPNRMKLQPNWQPKPGLPRTRQSELGLSVFLQTKLQRSPSRLRVQVISSHPRRKSRSSQWRKICQGKSVREVKTSRENFHQFRFSFLIYSGKYLQVGGHFQAVCHDLSKPQSLNNGRRSRGTHRLDAHALFAAGLPPSSVIRYQLEQWSSSHKHTSGEFYSRWMAHVALAVSLSLSSIYLHMLGGLRPLL